MAIKQKRETAKQSSRKGGEALSEPDKLLLASASNGDVESLRKALSSGANPDVRNELGDTPLHLATNSGRSKCLEILLPVSETRTRNHLGQTPLHRAASRGQAECLSLLLPQSDPSLCSNYSWTPLHCVAHYGNLECISILLPVSDPECPDKKGETPLSLAVYNGHSECVSIMERFVLARGEVAELESSAAPFASPRRGRRL